MDTVIPLTIHDHLSTMEGGGVFVFLMLSTFFVQSFLAWCMICIYIPGTHLSIVLPPKEGLFQIFQSKQGTFGFQVNTGVSKNRGTPKWMVYNGKPY